MVKFIELTDKKGATVCINVNSIIYFCPIPNSTGIYIKLETASGNGPKYEYEVAQDYVDIKAMVTPTHVSIQTVVLKDKQRGFGAS